MGAAMADNLRLRVVLDLVDRVLSPLKRISAGGTETARALKAAKDQLKQLNAQQAAVKNVQDQSAEFQRLNNQLKQRQALLDGMRARGDATRTAMAREENAVAKLTAALDRQRVAAGEARRKLNEMGITGSLSAAQARLKTDIDGATAAMTRQRAELAKMGEQHRKLAELRKKHGQDMMHLGMAAACMRGHACLRLPCDCWHLASIAGITHAWGQRPVACWTSHAQMPCCCRAACGFLAVRIPGIRRNPTPAELPRDPAGRCRCRRGAHAQRCGCLGR